MIKSNITKHLHVSKGVQMSVILMLFILKLKYCVKTGGGKLTYLAEQIYHNYVYTCIIVITYLLGEGVLL